MEIKTFEDCIEGCKGISYLHDDHEHKTCCSCGSVWNRVDNVLVSKGTRNHKHKKYTNDF